MTIPAPHAAQLLDTDEAVLRRAAELIGRAYRRQLWLLLIDEDGRQLPVLPVTDIPQRPDALARGHLATRLCEMAAEVGASSLAVVYERPGPERLTAADRQWLRLLAAAREAHRLPMRGPLMAHAHGVRWIAPEDLDDPVPAAGAGSGSPSP